jgi:hypothetical protein
MEYEVNTSQLEKLSLQLARGRFRDFFLENTTSIERLMEATQKAVAVMSTVGGIEGDMPTLVSFVKGGQDAKGILNSRAPKSWLK